MFTTLQKNLKEYYEKEKKESLTVKEAMRESTDRRIEQYENGEISEEQFCKCAVDRMNRRIEKDLKEKETEFENICNAPDLQSVTIVVDFTKNRTVATVEVEDSRSGYCQYKGISTDCGIDQASCAVADALNQSYVVLKAMYQCKENGLTNNNDETLSNNSQKFLGYGSGYGVLPYFERGVGLSSFWKIFNSMGFGVETIACTDTMEVYKTEKKEGQK